MSEMGRESRPRDFRARAFVLAILLCVPVTYATANAQVSHMFSLLVAPVGTLILLVFLNAFVRKFQIGRANV